MFASDWYEYSAMPMKTVAGLDDVWLLQTNKTRGRTFGSTAWSMGGMRGEQMLEGPTAVCYPTRLPNKRIKGRRDKIVYSERRQKGVDLPEGAMRKSWQCQLWCSRRTKAGARGGG